MATITANLEPDSDILVRRVLWETLTTTNDNGAAISMASFADRSVQVLGTFGAGGTIVLEGSNDGGTTYVTLKDPLGNNLSFTAAGLKMVGDLAYHVRPRVTAGDGTTDLDVYLLLRMNPR